jgi:ethylbenzene dioxygenase beta subunit
MSEPVGMEDFFLIQRFLTAEAGLLDRREYQGWLGVLTEDVDYRVVSQLVREAASTNADVAIIEENFSGLKSRLDQIGNPRLTHAENPVSFARRFVTNIDATQDTADSAFAVRSNILLYWSRPDDEGRVYSGARNDVLRRVGGELRLARRHVRLDHAMLRASITVLF